MNGSAVKLEAVSVTTKGKPEVTVLPLGNGQLRIYNLVAAANYAGVHPPTFKKIMERRFYPPERHAPCEAKVREAYPELFKEV